MRVCLLLSLTIGPFVSSGLGSLSKAVTNGSVRLGSVHLSLPGARLALWFGGAVTIVSGVRARADRHADAPCPPRRLSP